jgi:hypothetical protein
MLDLHREKLRRFPMGFLVFGTDKRTKRHTSYYLEEDDEAQARAETFRRGTDHVTFVSVNPRPAGYDPVSGYPTLAFRFRLWFSGFVRDLRALLYVSLFLGVFALIVVLLASFVGSPKSPSERLIHEQQMRDIYRGH